MTEPTTRPAWNPQDTGGSSPLLQLTLIRFREFLREPEPVIADDHQNRLVFEMA